MPNDPINSPYPSVYAAPPVIVTDRDTYPSIRAWSVRSQLLCQHEARARSVFVPKSLRVGATPVIDEGVLPNSLNTMRMYALLT